MTPPVDAWPTTIAAITLVTDDLEATDRFYREVFGLEPVFGDDASSVFRFGEALINLLRREAAPELVDPAPIAPVDAGVRSVMTVQVDDVDAWCARLRDRGVELLNGPMDRPWGPRTASFRDPSGQVWELAT
ncbi:VOC family protein [Aquihabitans sp. G128]|uniref:VOC family protein n=1 Tax=Aquihabitans sp. G128 TaxID=2849779 RepID=UPI001C2141C9|nr:VOC family protein [Aquihabitans sp. G128]QXC61073.1 VOC family protein [Aquihabitans sp. G128]